METFTTPTPISSYTGQINKCITGCLADKKHVIALFIPPVLIALMYPIFNSLAGVLANDRIAWYLGLITYWLIWGIVFPIIIIGKKDLLALIRPQKPARKMLLPTSIILLGALAASLFVPGMEYEKQSTLILILLLSTCLGNGFFEELLWRGVYYRLFPDNIFCRMIWPSVWFGIWHYVPVSINNSELTGLIGMIVGPIMMGLVLSYMTKKTNTLWWAIIAHTVGGTIMIA
jgi:membrane protease YdiL (CAAX protease family)